jgi:hypothetical protein
MSGYIPGEGCKLQLEISTVFTDIANVTSLTAPTMTVGEVEYTNIASTNKRFRPSAIPESGTISGEINFDPDEATHAQLFTLIKTPALKNWKIVFTDASTVTTFAFSGFLTSLNIGNIADAQNVNASFTIRVDGAIT